ncbi:unnamed protein product, partial [marine sediment metagenome]
HISRIALYIGPGNINTMSEYHGSNVVDGEDSVTGITVQGQNYGILIQNPSLVFNPVFGGIGTSIASGGGDYSVAQFGGFGTIDKGSGTYIPGNEVGGSSVEVIGDQSAVVITTDFGTLPVIGPDEFQAYAISWASGIGKISFTGYSGDSSTTGGMVFGEGEFKATAEFNSLVNHLFFKANHD